MPFTPYHLGIALLIGVLFYKYIDLISVLVGSVILDVWPFLVVFLHLPYPLHGVSHSFLIAVMWAVVLIVVRLKSPFFKKKSLKVISLSALIGTFSHVVLDTPLYKDIVPFWPSSRNPFLGLYVYSDAVLFCSVCFVGAFIILLYNYCRYKTFIRTK